MFSGFGFGGFGLRLEGFKVWGIGFRGVRIFRCLCVRDCCDQSYSQLMRSLIAVIRCPLSPSTTLSWF